MKLAPTYLSVTGLSCLKTWARLAAPSHSERNKGHDHSRGTHRQHSPTRLSHRRHGRSRRRAARRRGLGSGHGPGRGGDRGGHGGHGVAGHHRRRAVEAELRHLSAGGPRQPRPGRRRDSVRGWPHAATASPHRRSVPLHDLFRSLRDRGEEACQPAGQAGGHRPFGHQPDLPPGRYRRLSARRLCCRLGERMREGYPLGLRSRGGQRADRFHRGDGCAASWIPRAGC